MLYTDLLHGVLKNMLTLLHEESTVVESLYAFILVQPSGIQRKDVVYINRALLDFKGSYILPH